MKLGDAVKKVTDAVGIKQCGACERRQKRLNELSDRIAKAVGEKRRELRKKRQRLLDED